MAFFLLRVSRASSASLLHAARAPPSLHRNCSGLLLHRNHHPESSPPWNSARPGRSSRHSPRALNRACSVSTHRSFSFVELRPGSRAWIEHSNLHPSVALFLTNQSSNSDRGRWSEQATFVLVDRLELSVWCLGWQEGPNRTGWAFHLLHLECLKAHNPAMANFYVFSGLVSVFLIPFYFDPETSVYPERSLKLPQNLWSCFSDPVYAICTNKTPNGL